MADELLNNMLDMDEEDRKIVLEDEETGEAIEFILDDAFKFNGKDYVVLLRPVDDPEEGSRCNLRLLRQALRRALRR